MKIECTVKELKELIKIVPVDKATDTITTNLKLDDEAIKKLSQLKVQQNQ